MTQKKAPGPKKSSKNLTVTLTTKVTAEEAELLKGEAKARGNIGLSPLLRELILDSVKLPTPTTLILESVLGTQFAMFEMARKAAEGTPLPPARIVSLQEKLELAGATLIARFMHKRVQIGKEG